MDRHSEHRHPMASLKKDYGGTSAIIQLSCAPCQLQRCSQAWPHGVQHQRRLLRDDCYDTHKPAGRLAGYTSEEKSCTQQDCRAAISSGHFAPVFRSSRDSLVAGTHWLNSVSFNPFNTSLFKIILAQGPRGGWMAGSL